MKRFWLLVFVVTVVGCAAVKETVDDYEACKKSPLCVEEARAAGESAGTVARAAATSAGVPSIPELVAMLVSSAVSFGVGVARGRKLRK